MNEDRFGPTMDEFDEPIDEERMGYSTTDQRKVRRRSFLNFMPRAKTLIIIGAGILFVIILIALFAGGNSELSKKDLADISARLDLFENRLTRLEEGELRIATLQKQGNIMQQSFGETDRLIKSLTQRVDSLTRSLEAREKETASAAKETASPAGIKPKAVSPDKRRVHEVRKGENLYQISLKYGLTVDKLCKLNKIDPKQAIYPGQKLLVAPGAE